MDGYERPEARRRVPGPMHLRLLTGMSFCLRQCISLDRTSFDGLHVVEAGALHSHDIKYKSQR